MRGLRSAEATPIRAVAAASAGPTRVIWAMEHPRAGVVEADSLDHARVLEIALPYLGPMVGEYSERTPLVGRPSLFPEELDLTDPWQFENFRVR